MATASPEVGIHTATIEVLAAPIEFEWFSRYVEPEEDLDEKIRAIARDIFGDDLVLADSNFEEGSIRAIIDLVVGGVVDYGTFVAGVSIIGAQVRWLIYSILRRRWTGQPVRVTWRTVFVSSPSRSEPSVSDSGSLERYLIATNFLMLLTIIAFALVLLLQG